MRADRIEVSWDAPKSKWLVRVQNGEEVIRRHSDAPKNVGETQLRQAAVQTAQDEGYEAEPSQVTILK